MHWPFRQTETLEPGAPPEMTREELLREELRLAQVALNQIDSEARAFRKENFATVNGVVCIRASHIGGRKAVEDVWRAYLHKIEQLMQRRNVLLKEFAEVKTGVQL
jgi:hypothetical protein